MSVTPSYRERLIRNYREAYERANGKPAPIVTYSIGGWFKFGNSGVGYRRAAVEEMLECLRERPAYSAPAFRNLAEGSRCDGCPEPGCVVCPVAPAQCGGAAE